MRILTAIFIVLSFVSFAFGQHKVEGSISGYPNKNLLLLEYFGDKHQIIDSTRTDGNGWFSFELPENTPSGLYSLAAASSPLFNFIYNNENVILKYDPSTFRPPEFIESVENMVYYDYLVNRDLFDQKAEMIIDILRYYPETDSFYQSSGEHFLEIQSTFGAYSEMLINEYPESLVSHIIASDRPVMYPDNMEWDYYISYNQKHFLDEVNFNDSVLINTNILTAKAIDYLGFYAISGQNKDLQEDLFIQAVDTILHRAMENSNVYNFLMQYLIEGFEMYGFDRVISHIAANYEPANTCVNEELKTELQKRVENLRLLAVGNTAPDIEFIAEVNGFSALSDIGNERILVLFWASWCPHCNQMIPQLMDLYEDTELHNFEVLAVSLDTNYTDYTETLSGYATKWINYADLKGWDSKPAVDYSIYATPTMFLLDKNRKILARPVTVQDLRNELLK